jgi:hypothetical protein
MKVNRLSGSMGDIGGYVDKEAMESAFALLQKNVRTRPRWAT